MCHEVELYVLCSKYIIRQISKSTTYIYCTCDDPADRNKLYCVIANPHRVTRTLFEKLVCYYLTASSGRELAVRMFVALVYFS